MAALFPVEYVAYICLWCNIGLWERVPFSNNSVLLLHIIDPRLIIFRLHVVFVSFCVFSFFLCSLRESSILELITDCLPFGSQAHAPVTLATEHTCVKMHIWERNMHTLTYPHCTLYIGYTKVTFLDFIRDCFIMADRCAHKSQVPWWSKTIQNNLIKAKQWEKGKGKDRNTDRRLYIHINTLQPLTLSWRVGFCLSKQNHHSTIKKKMSGLSVAVLKWAAFITSLPFVENRKKKILKQKLRFEGTNGQGLNI